MMLLTLSWRNIWRNKRRSIIILIAVAIGVIATVLMDTLSRGMIHQMLYNQVGSHVAHLQVHRTGFRDDPVIQLYVPDADTVDTVLKETPGISRYSSRVLTFGLISSAASSAGVSIVGIDPEREQQVTSIKRFLIEGNYLSGNFNEVVIGNALAEKLDVGIGDRVVGMASAVDGHIGSDVFRVVGVFETMSSEFDKSKIYISRPNAQGMLGLGNHVSEFAIILENLEQLQEIRESIRNRLGDDYEVHSYPEILPLLVLTMDMYDQSMIIFYAIIGTALIFGIINTMLMSVFERIHELGVLKAIGMKDGKILLMVLCEAFFLGIMGTMIGFALGYLLYLPLSHYGIDLSLFAESLRSFGVGAIIYPVLTGNSVLNALFIIPVFAVLGALYPALRAVRFHPVEAIRYV